MISAAVGAIGKPSIGMRVSVEVRDAIRAGEPVVALESTVLAHGLPRPTNLEVGKELEDIIRRDGVVPATVGVIDGVPVVGLDAGELEQIATERGILKLSTRDLPVAMSRRASGATTVASTAFLAARAGVRVFATGGIGGVHRGLAPDISSDLLELQRTRMVVVCAGAKSILDVPATRELLETLGILVVGWKTDRFAGFYSCETDLSVDVRVDEPDQVAGLWNAQSTIDGLGAILVCAPIPTELEIPAERIDEAIRRALELADSEGVRGKDVTPFLLRSLTEATKGETLAANVALLRNNVGVASMIARSFGSNA